MSQGWTGWDPCGSGGGLGIFQLHSQKDALHEGSSPHQGNVKWWKFLPQSISWGFNIIPPSLHPGIPQPPWDLFLNPATPRRFLEWGEVLPSAVFPGINIHQVGKLSLKMEQGFGTRISSHQLATEGYQESTARSSFISYPKNHGFGKRGKKF